MTRATTEERVWGISLGSSSWAANCINVETGNELELIDSKGKPAPSIIFPRLPGEPIRLDIWDPMHPRGSGMAWPPESVVSKDVGSGRMPVSAAWTARQQEMFSDSEAYEDLQWRWKIDDATHQFGVEEGIAESIAQLCRFVSSESPSAVAIPNDFKQKEQQLVIDMCRSQGCDVTLLWSPVAAALVWLDRFGANLGDFESERRTLLHVHLDWGATRFTELEIVSRNDPKFRRWLPARTRPRESDLIPGFGWSQFSSDATPQDQWRSYFSGSPLGDLRYRRLREGSTSILRRIQGWEIRSEDSRIHLESFKDRLLQNQNRLLGVVATGDFANFKFEGTLSLDSLIDFEVSELSATSILAPGIRGEQLFAEGAAIFANHNQNGVVSYLDSLPDLDLFVEKTGSFAWLPLLGDENDFVPGGQTWTRSEPIRGLSVRKGSTDLRLVVAHEEYKGVREISALLSESADQRLSAELHVSAVAAQGNATLRLKLLDNENFHKGEILADWRRMKPILDENSSPIGKVEYLENQPRAFPEIAPRLRSANSWARNVKYVRQMASRMAERGKDLTRLANDLYFLKQLNAGFQQKDQTQYPNDATAIGSDFTCPGSQSELQLFADNLLDLFGYCIEKNANGTSLVVRILGYISVDSKKFEDWLIGNLHPRFQDGGAVRHTFGLCARNTNNIASFIQRLFRPVSLPRTNDMKAVSQILRYRANATEEISGDLADLVFEKSTSIFERELENGGRSFNFRWSSLVIVFLLRRRMFDPEFADPNGTLALKAKDLFQNAISECRSGRVRPIGGSVDVPAALQQMIDYIDKKGRGDILMSSE